MQIVLDLVDDGYVDISTRRDERLSKGLNQLQIGTSSPLHCFIISPSTEEPSQYFDFISEYVESISETLRPVNLKIHDNPELNYEEFIAHETLTKFMRTRKGWKVTPSAYGIATAFIAEYDSGKKGPVISFNAEYGMHPVLVTRGPSNNSRCTEGDWPFVRSQSHCYMFSSWSTCMR